MTAWRIERFGGPEVLDQHTVPVVEPSGDEVLVRVAFCGVCRHDLLTRNGVFPKVPLPLTLGHQVSGTVVAAGPAAGFETGARVMSTIFMGCGECDACRSGNQAVCRTGRALFMGDDFDGGYAEYIRAPARAFVRVPDDVSLLTASVVNCTLGTGYHAIHTRAQLQAGETVVITGSSGGLGVHAIDVAKHAGARVIAITTRDTQEARLRERGADEVIVAADVTFAKRVKELTGGIGADAVLEIAGEPTLAESLHAVRTGGRVVTVGNVSAKPSEVRIAHLIMKEISLLGTKSCSNAELGTVMRLVAAGELSVDIDRVVPLDDVRQAHADMETHRSAGRIVLEIGGDLGDGR